MRTQQEVEKMKDGIQKRIDELSDQIRYVCEQQYPSPSIESLSDNRRQLMAQYNILLEVLK